MYLMKIMNILKLIINMVYTKIFKSYVKVIDSLIHSVRLVGTDTDVKEMVLVVD